MIAVRHIRSSGTQYSKQLTIMTSPPPTNNSGDARGNDGQVGPVVGYREPEVLFCYFCAPSILNVLEA